VGPTAVSPLQNIFLPTPLQQRTSQISNLVHHYYFSNYRRSRSWHTVQAQ